MLFVWAIALVYVRSSENLANRSLESILTAESHKAKELQSKLDMFKEVKDVIDTRDLYETRSQWMLLLLKNDLGDECLKVAKIQFEEMKADKTLSIGDRIRLYEQLAIIYRGLEKFDRVPPIYNDLEIQAKNSLDRDKDLVSKMAQNNRVVSEYFVAMSLKAPSKKSMDKRVELLSQSCEGMSELEKDILDGDPSFANLQKVVHKNKGVMSEDLSFAQLRLSRFEKRNL